MAASDASVAKPQQAAAAEMTEVVAGAESVSAASSVAAVGGSMSAESAAGGGRSPSAAGSSGSASSPQSAGSSAVAPVPAADSGGAVVVTRGLNEVDTLVPHRSWSCGMPDGIPAPKSGARAFEVELQLGEVHELGRTHLGERVLYEIRGGTVKGEQLSAQVLERGLDWELTLPNGVMEIEQVAILRTDDGTNIFMRSCGVSPSSDSEIRMVADIEAPSSGRYSWLNDAVLVGTRSVDRMGKRMTLSVYSVEGAVADAAKVAIEEPDALPQQSWDCAPALGQRGSTLYMVVELKACQGLLPIHFAQVLSYLKASEQSLGLLINFNVRVLRQGVRRVVHTR